MKRINEWLKQGHIVQIKQDGIFVAEKPSDFYHDQQIAKPTLNALGNDFVEIQVMQSDTKGNFAKTGKPVPAIKGHFNWLRAKDTQDVWSDWLLRSVTDKFLETDAARSQASQIVTDASLVQSKKRTDFRDALKQNISKKKEIGNIIAVLQQSKTK